MLRGNRAWHIILGLALLGIADSTYLLLFQTRKVESLVCPVFGGGCEAVSRSPMAYPAGIPDAIFGVIGYSLAALTAAAIPLAVGKAKKWLAVAAMVGTVGAACLSGYLVYAQSTLVGNWCFWCLMSAMISMTMAPVAVIGGRQLFREEPEEESPAQRLAAAS